MKTILFLFIVLFFNAQAIAETKQKKQNSFQFAKSLFESGQFVRALMEFSKGTQMAQDSYSRTRAYYYQGLCLFELGYYFSSYVSFRNVLLHADIKNKQMYEKAIKNAVVITDRLGMVDRVGSVLKDVPGSLIVSSVSDMANYAIGVHYLFNNRFGEAESHLKSVNPESQFYRKATLYLGILSTREKNYKDARFYFSKVIELTRGKRIYKDLEGVARLDLARSAYSMGNVDRSIRLYSHFTGDSPHWLTVLLEASWPLMRANDTTVSLGNLHTLTSPFYQEEMVGEAYVLRATILFSLCKYEEMRRTLAEFYEIYDPVLRSMQAEQNNLKGKGAFYEAFHTRKGMNRAFYSFASKDVGIQKMQGVLKLLKEERNDISRYSQNSEIRNMIKRIESAERSVESEIDDILRELHERKLKELKGQREQANYLKVEVVTGEKELIQQGKGLPPKRVVEVDTSVAEGYEYWPFDGEFWDDESGAYVYTTASSCVQ